jgi:hypothetical protein
MRGTGVELPRLRGRLRGQATALGGLLLALAGLAVTAGSAPAPALAAAAGLATCGNPGLAPGPVQHVILVMFENNSYSGVIGSSSAPYQTSLAAQCGSATAMFGATHASAANYLAVSAGEYPPSSPAGCGSVAACADASDNLYHQLSAAGQSWRGYVESMPSPCAATSGGSYKIGHNPILFYTDLTSAQCQAGDLPADSLTAASGVFWDDLQNQALPAFSWVTPNLDNDGDGPAGQAGLQAADTWLQNFLGLVTQSPSYQAGNTLVLVTYDEGTGPDYATGEDCTTMSLDLPVTSGVSAHQDSCHTPLLVVYPYTPAGASDGTFFDLYSITRTVEDLFGLPYLGHAGDAQTASLAGHFGIPLATGTACPPTAPGMTELSGNLSLESGQSGWTGVFNATSRVTRVQPPGGSYDGSWALQVAPASGNSGTAGVNNAGPVWVPGPPGTASTAASTYAGSAFVRGSVPGEQVSLLVREITPGGTGAGFHTTTMTLGDTAWHQVTSTYTAQASGDLIKYSLYASNLASSAQYFQADCLSLQTPTG